MQNRPENPKPGGSSTTAAASAASAETGGPLIRRLTVVAPGLLGGSLALVCRERRLAETVVGVARRQESIDEGIRMGAFDWGTTNLSDGVRDAEMVVIGAPVRASADLLRQMAPHVDPDAVVTDVGSTKAWIMEEAGRVLPGQFVGGHPMAGSHRSGLKSAQSHLFTNALYLLTAGAETPDALAQRVERLVIGLGSRILWLDPAEHDRLVARISHLPHLAACALVECAGNARGSSVNALDLAASGFRDTTRVAAGHPEMWTDICLTNRDGILESLDVMMESLMALRGWLAREDEGAVSSWLTEQASLRRSVKESSGASGE